MAPTSAAIKDVDIRWRTPFVASAYAPSQVCAADGVFIAKTDKQLATRTVAGEANAMTVEANVLFIASSNGSLVALELPSLTPKWRALAISQYESALVVVDGTVFLQSMAPAFLQLFDAQTGASRVRNPLGHSSAMAVLPSPGNGTRVAVDAGGSAIWGLIPTTSSVATTSIVVEGSVVMPPGVHQVRVQVGDTTVLAGSDGRFRATANGRGIILVEVVSFTGSRPSWSSDLLRPSFAEPT
jgi:outer membrane protein assembly factor BamB